MFSLVFYVFSYPRFAFFEKIFWSNTIYKDVGALCICPLHTAHSPARAGPHAASHSGTPKEWHTKSNLSLETLTICPQILRSVVLHDCLYSPVIFEWIIRSPKPALPARGRRAPHNMHVCMLANMNLSLGFPKDTWPADPPADQKAEQCPGLTDRCSSRLKLKKIKLHYNLPCKRIPPLTVELYSANIHQHCFFKLRVMEGKEQLGIFEFWDSQLSLDSVAKFMSRTVLP